MKNSNTHNKVLGLASALALVIIPAISSHAATLQFDGSTDSDWTDADNWSILPGPNPLGNTPWDHPSAPGDDISLGADMTVNSTETYTTGANSGNAFQVRRITVGSRTITIQNGGTLDFGGGNDGKIDLTSNGSTLIMSGGTLQSDSGNLFGINLMGNNSLLDIGGSSTVNIFDPGSASQGVNFNNALVSREMIVRGSNASISLEALRIASGASNINLSFVLDAGGASAVGVTDLVEWDLASSLALNLTNPGSAWNGTGNVLLYDLTAGSSGTFDSIVTGAGTYSATEGELIQLNPGGDTFTFTYLLGDGNDIGLIGVAIPEPSTLALLLAGGVLIMLRRRHSLVQS